MEHGVSCALLALARDLLNSGLNDRLKEAAIAASGGLTIATMCKLCHRALQGQQDAVLASFESMIELYCQNTLNDGKMDLAGYLVGQTCGNLFQTDTPHSTTNSGDDSKASNGCKLSCCNIQQGLHGRQLHTECGVGRGHVLLTESPMAAVIKTPCDCHEKVILVEYITLTWAIGLLMYFDSCASQIKSPLQSEVWQQLPSSPLPADKKKQFLEFLLNFQCHTNKSNVISTWECNDMPLIENNQFVWPFDVICLLVCCSVLMSLYTQHCYSNDLDRIGISLDPEVLYQILSRIPTNIHAVFAVLSDRDQIRQQRLGFGLFNNASSINHNCDPNATLRYHFDKNVEKLDSLQQKRKALLNSVQIEIVPIRSIQSYEEVCISYGPIAGSHHYNARQECLSTQFLFQCKCVSCVKELQGSQLSSRPSTAADPTIESKDKVQLMTDACVKLNHYRDTVEMIDIEIEELLFLKATGKRVTQFYETSLLPLHKDFEDFHSKYFPESMNVTTRKKLPIYPTGSAVAGLFIEFISCYLRLLDNTARLLSSVGKYLESTKFIEDAINWMIISGKYKMDDVIVGREQIKLGQLYFSGGDFKMAKRITQQAMETIHPFVSHDDPDLMDGKCMLHFLMTHK